jgi:TorA maturation chaperone TorD
MMSHQAAALNLAPETPPASVPLPTSAPVAAVAAQMASHGEPAPEDAARSGVYALLAALLRDVPDAELLAGVRELAPSTGRDAFAQAWERLRLAAASVEMSAMDDEYHQLFIGLGRGELVPYGSWYQTGYLMERPLSQLRDDLAALGFERSPDVREPEDHVAALCEVMAELAQDPSVDIAGQRAFYEAHMGAWVGRFWSDLEQAETALFYRSVGRLGVVFNELEQRFLTMDA